MDRLDSGEAIYGHKWQRRRRLWLLNHPLCCYCDDQGRVTKATVVDHIIPHRGNAELFWDETNWQSLCKECHDSAKQSEEKKGYSNAVGSDGWPLDDKHPVNRYESNSERTHDDGVRVRGKQGTPRVCGDDKG